MRKITNVLLALAIIFCFSISNTNNFDIQETKASEPNLLTNGDFEAVSSGKPDGWQIGTNANYSYTIVDGESGNGFKLTNSADSGIPIITSPYMDAKLGDYFKIKFSYLVDPSYAESRPRLYLAWSAAAPNEAGTKIDDPTQSQSVRIDSSNADGKWHQNEYIVYGIMSPQVKFIRIQLGGFRYMKGAVTYDNISVEKTSFTPDRKYGCTNSSTSACVDFGGSDESGISAGIAGGANSQIDIAKTDGDTTYREIKNQKLPKVLIKSWNTDDQGLPKNDLILEVRYKDTFSSNPSPSEYYDYSGFRSQVAALSSQVNFGSGLTNLSRLLGFGDFGDNTWKTVQIVLPKNNWQMVRAINGNFNFTIAMPTPTIAGTTLSLPIDYMSLTEVTPEEVQAFQKKQRDIRYLRQVDYVETKSRPAIASDFSWFTSPSTEQIFPNYYPEKSAINKPMPLQSAIGETEPGNFSIITNKEIPNISLAVTDLNSENGAISSNNINLYKVVYDLKYWTGESGLRSIYGLQPDRYEKFDKITVPANKTQQFYYTITVPEDTAGGVYTGKIILSVDGVQKTTIPVSVEVLAMKLDAPSYLPYLYHNPIDETYYNFYGDKMLADAANHDISGSTRFLDYTTTNTNGVLSFDYTTFEKNLKLSINSGITKDKVFYYYLSSVVLGIKNSLGLTGNDWEIYTNPAFEAAFLKWVDGLQLVAAKYNTEIVYAVNDEPGTNLGLRIAADRLLRLLRQKNVKTWTTYWPSCETPVPCAICTPCPDCSVVDGVNNLPSIAGLIDYKVYAMAYLTDDNILKEPSTFGYYTTYFSQIRNPVYARFWQGVYPVKTNAKAVGTFATATFTGDPYNDFDSFSTHRLSSTELDYQLVYPSWDGQLIPTTAWEATREGIKDNKYIATLRRLISFNKEDPIAIEASSYLDSLISRTTLSFLDSTKIVDNYGYASEILRQISKTSDKNDAAAFDQMRSTIFDYIKRLDRPAITITSDRKIAATGSIVTFTVSGSNPTTMPLKNLVITAPISSGYQYKVASATKNGTFTDNEIAWRLPELAAGEVFEATYKVVVD